MDRTRFNAHFEIHKVLVSRWWLSRIATYEELESSNNTVAPGDDVVGYRNVREFQVDRLNLWEFDSKMYMLWWTINVTKLNKWLEQHKNEHEIALFWTL